MVRVDRRPPRDFAALDRLAQTRAEITELIAPELAYPDAEDSDLYDMPVQPPGQARRYASAAYRAADAAARRQAEREAVAAWAADVEPPPRTRRSSQRTAAEAGPRARSFGGPIWGPLLRNGASIWWRHHPAHAAFQVADSALSHVASRKPYLMLGLAAGAGALVMLIRPWRLVSITGLLLAAFKMTDLRSLFGSFRRGG